MLPIVITCDKFKQFELSYFVIKVKNYSLFSFYGRRLFRITSSIVRMGVKIHDNFDCNSKLQFTTEQVASTECSREIYFFYIFKRILNCLKVYIFFSFLRCA